MSEEARQIMADAEKWRQLMDYFEHWPFSPYDDIEYRALPKAIREIRDCSGVQDGAYAHTREEA